MYANIYTKVAQKRKLGRNQGLYFLVPCNILIPLLKKRITQKRPIESQVLFKWL